MMTRHGHQSVMNEDVDRSETLAAVVRDIEGHIPKPANHPTRLTNQAEIPISAQQTSSFSAAC